MIYDITQPLFESEVLPIHPRPELRPLRRIANGDAVNASNIFLCVHNGTHVDAPWHFLADGKKIDQVDLEKFIGPAYVAECVGDVTAVDAQAILDLASTYENGAEKRILIKGKATITLEAAEVFAKSGCDLVGNESQVVGPEDSPAAVHRCLLGAEIVILEGIRLAHVPDGAYNLHCLPLNLTGIDGSPVRAVLTDLL